MSISATTNEGVTRILLSPREMTQVREKYIKDGTFFIKGTHSTWVPKYQVKYLARSVVKPWPDVEGLVLPMTPGEAARVELKRQFPGLKRVGWPGAQVRLFDWRWPMYFKRPYEGYIYYYDLSAAYWQIYRMLWLNVAFPRGFGSLDLLPVATRLEHWKEARNAVIGSIASRKTQAVKDGRVINLSTQNNFLSPNLWATVQAILNEVASVAKDCGAIYCLTDGYFIPASANPEGFGRYLTEWRFRYKLIKTMGNVKGWMSYSLENGRTTELFKKGFQGGRPFELIKLARPRDNFYFVDWWAHTVRKYRGIMEVTE